MCAFEPRRGVLRLTIVTSCADWVELPGLREMMSVEASIDARSAKAQRILALYDQTISRQYLSRRILKPPVAAVLLSR